MVRPFATTFVLLLALGCHSVGGTDQHDGRSGSVSAGGTAPSSSSAAPDAPVDDWREAARRFQWKRAYQLLKALPKAERDKPDTRLALGRVALELGEYAAAAEALRGLEEKLPLLKDEIRGWYAQAAAIAGPHDDAAKILEASPKVVDLIRAAEAHERAGKLPAARTAIDKAIKRADQTRRGADEERAHAVRARIAEKMGKQGLGIAAGDWRWIALQGGDDARIREAVAGLDRVGGRLTLDERLSVLARSTEPANVEATLTDLDVLKKKSPAKVVEIALARARALENARDWPRARDAFVAAAKLPSAFVPEAKYYAARCAIRNGEREWALDMLNDVVAHSTNIWGERSIYRKALVLMQLGRYEESAKSYAQYYTRFGQGEYAAEARYGQAIALLSGGKAAKAKPLLVALRKSVDQKGFEASLQHLEALAAERAGDDKTAKRLWLELVTEQPLTWAGLAAHARLSKLGHTPLPPLMPESPSNGTLPPLSVSLPAAPALLRSVGLDVAAEDRLAHMEQEAARGYPGRESEALCEMYGLLSCAGRRHYVGSRAVSLEQLMRPPRTNERWTWSCVYPDPYSELVAQEEKRQELPAGLLYAVMRQESAFKPGARSPVGARGLMQLMPETARRAAAELDLHADMTEIERPDLNLRLGAFYLKKLLKTFSGSLPLAVAAYNAGPKAVSRWMNGDRETDLWIARIPYDETRRYVEAVLGNLARYQWLSGGTAAVTPLALELPTEIAIDDDAY